MDRLATALTALGVKKGDAIAIYMQSCPQFMIAFYAAQRIGASVGPCSPMFKEWELEYEINELNARVIIANTYLYPIIKNVKDSTPLEHIIVSSFKDFLPEEPALPFILEYEDPTDLDGAIQMMDLIKSTTPNTPSVDIDIENDVSLIIFMVQL